jgi:hypothetical protein
MEDLLQQGEGQALTLLSSEDPTTWPEDYRLRAERNQKGARSPVSVSEGVPVHA